MANYRLRIGHAGSYATSFPDTENPLSQSGRWRVGSATGFYKNPRTTPGKCFAASFVDEAEQGNYDDCLAQLVMPSIGVNHYAQCTIFREAGYDTPGNTHENGLYLRINIGEEFVTGYEILMEAQGSFSIVRWEGTTHDIENYTNLSFTGDGPGVLAHGDVVRASIVGSQIRVYKNSVEVASVIDATHASGAPGMGFFVRSGDTTPVNYCMSAWSAGVSS